MSLEIIKSNMKSQGYRIENILEQLEEAENEMKDLKQLYAESLCGLDKGDLVTGPQGEERIFNRVEFSNFEYAMLYGFKIKKDGTAYKKENLIGFSDNWKK